MSLLGKDGGRKVFSFVSQDASLVYFITSFAV